MIQRITNTARDYAWGSTSLIPDYFGIAATGKPMAEIWFGTHEGSPTQVEGSGHTLVQLRDGKHLSFLLKILAADSPLSIQAHPTIAQAKAGFAKENALGIALDAFNRNYKDEGHKPEMLVALTEFRALTGFRDLQETKELLQEIANYASGSFANEFENWAWLITDSMEPLVRELLESRNELASHTSEFADACAALLEAKPNHKFAGSLALVSQLEEQYPADPGVVIALLMNYVELQPNQAVQLAAGNIHAYLSGLGVEIMAESDNVLRGGLTPKHIDVDELQAIVNFNSEEPPLVQPKELSHGLWEYPRAVDDYLLYRFEVSGQNLMADINLPAESIMLCTAGEVLVTDSQDSLVKLKAGEAAYLAEARLFSVSGSGTAFLATH